MSLFGLVRFDWDNGGDREFLLPQPPAIAAGVLLDPQYTLFGALGRGVRDCVPMAEQLCRRAPVLLAGAAGDGGAKAPAGGVQYHGFWWSWRWSDAEY